uniref:Protein kinase domain-containing protein n=1 Tax=Eutreptiella gymnastica TaxID=73025 RepID=A0A7S1J7V5_9EUGL
MWMAPEVIARADYTVGSDIWSLGCTVVEMTTGRPPWHEMGFANEIEAAYYIGQADTPPPLPGCLSPTALDLLQTCFSLVPNRRGTTDRLLDHRWLSDEFMDVVSVCSTPQHHVRQSAAVHRMHSNASCTDLAHGMFNSSPRPNQPPTAVTSATLPSQSPACIQLQQLSSQFRRVSGDESLLSTSDYPSNLFTEDHTMSMSSQSGSGVYELSLAGSATQRMLQLSPQQSLSSMKSPSCARLEAGDAQAEGPTAGSSQLEARDPEVARSMSVVSIEPNTVDGDPLSSRIPRGEVTVLPVNLNRLDESHPPVASSRKGSSRQLISSRKNSCRSSATRPLTQNSSRGSVAVGNAVSVLETRCPSYGLADIAEAVEDPEVIIDYLRNQGKPFLQTPQASSSTPPDTSDSSEALPYPLVPSPRGTSLIPAGHGRPNLPKVGGPRVSAVVQKVRAAPRLVARSGRGTKKTKGDKKKKKVSSATVQDKSNTEPIKSSLDGTMTDNF